MPTGSAAGWVGVDVASEVPVAWAAAGGRRFWLNGVLSFAEG